MRRHAVLVFSVLTLALTFATLPLRRGVLPLLIVFVPALVVVGEPADRPRAGVTKRGHSDVAPRAISSGIPGYQPTVT